jgi:3-hydroxyisobutyrate dehydrogenase
MVRKMRVAVLGTGIMGFPIARNIAAAGIEVSAWNRTAERAEPLRGHGVEVAEDVAETVEGADLVITILRDGDAVESVMTEGGGVDACGDGTVWAQMSTVGLQATERLASLAADAGVRFVDAPVLGTKQPAEQGQLTVLASGPEDARGVCDPAFDAVGRETIWLDGAGDGQRLKMVANSWVVGITEAAAETLALAEKLGVPQKSFLELIEGGPLDSSYAQTKGRMMIVGEFPPSFPLELAAKDAGLILDAADGSNLRLPLLEAVRDQMNRAVELGHGDEDMAATFRAATESD